MSDTTVDFLSDQVILIMYRGGAYGNFITHVLTNYIDNTVKVYKEFTFSNTGNSHATVKYINPYLSALHLTNLAEYNKTYKPKIKNVEVLTQINNGSKILILCDTGVIDNVQYLLTRWPNAKIIRIYMHTFIEKLIAYANLLSKTDSPIMYYKNSLFDRSFIDKVKQLPGDLDENIIDSMVTLFKQDFNIYGKTYASYVKNPRVFNLRLKDLFTWETFNQAMLDLSVFIESKLVNIDRLQHFYGEFYKKQENFKYVEFDKNTICSSDDLIGTALVRFYKENNA